MALENGAFIRVNNIPSRGIACMLLVALLICDYS